MATRKKDTTADTSKGVIINQLVIRTLNRQTQSIDKWRTALKSADNGRLSALYNLYEDIRNDNTLKNAIGKRIRPITNAGLTFTVNNEEVPEINDLIKTKAFRKALREIMNAKMWGITILELSFVNQFDVWNIPRTHINTKNKIIGKNETDDFGISYESDPFLIVVEGEEKFGEILAACPYVIYKRGNFGDWAQFAELFGMPFREGIYDAFDGDGKRLLDEALDKAGSAPWVTHPKGTEIKYIENKANSNGALYDLLRKACNEEILVGLLGQTMTTVQGDKGARSLGEVHQEVEDGIHADDRVFVETVLNTQLLPLLEARGFKVAGGSFSFPELGETIGLKDRVDIDTKLDEIIEIEPDYFYETYGIPKPKDGGGKKAPAITTPDRVSNPVRGEKKTPQKEKVKLNDDDAIELRDEKHFWKLFFSFFASAPGSGALKVGNRHTINAIEGFTLSETLSSEDFLKRFYDERPDFDIPLYQNTSSNLIKNFREGWKRKDIKLADIGFDYGFTSEVAQTMMELNLFHFSAAKTLAECQELNAIYRQAKSFEEFLKLAQPKHDIFNKTWAETEYTTAGLVAESAATYYRLLGQVDIFPYWCYLTQADNRVREAHQKLHGLILPADDPRWNKLYPPNDWGDRCYVVPRTRKEGEKVDFAAMRQLADEYLNSPEAQKAAAQGWGINRAELKQVFSANQMYIRKFPGKASKQLDNLIASDYGLNSISNEIKNALNVVSKYKGTAQAWFDAQEKQVGDAILKDYNNRHIVLTSETYKATTTGKMADQVAYLDAMKETLTNPAEVWINGNLLDSVVLIRFYQDEVLAVVCQVEGGKVNKVKSWVPLLLGKAEINKYRSGLLIQK